MIDHIWEQDVREISESDAAKEGLSNRAGFLTTWCRMYDPDFFFWYRKGLGLYPDGWCWVNWTGKEVRRSGKIFDHDGYATTLDGMIATALRDRPSELYQAWVLEFHLCTSLIPSTPMNKS